MENSFEEIGNENTNESNITSNIDNVDTVVKKYFIEHNKSGKYFDNLVSIQNRIKDEVRGCNQTQNVALPFLRVCDIPQSVFPLGHLLQRLDISNNNISEIPSQIKELTHLKEVIFIYLIL